MSTNGADLRLRLVALLMPDAVSEFALLAKHPVRPTYLLPRGHGVWHEAMLLAWVAMLMCMPARAADDYADVASQPAALRAEEVRPYDRRGIARDTAYFVGYQ